MECDWLYENVTPLNEDGFVVISMYCFTPLYSLRHLSLMACKEPLMIHNSTVVAVINIIEEKKDVELFILINDTVGNHTIQKEYKPLTHREFR